MNYSPKVSVVVPVYNNEKYLEECVDSILAQTLREIEIILVDDGSTDSSPAICDKYAAQDERVKVIHQKNGGSGVAFNTGMDAAQGEYVGFVESDDWITEDMYDELYRKAKQWDIDVVKSLYTEQAEGVEGRLINKFSERRLHRYYYKRLDNAKLMPELVRGHMSHWSAIYRRSFLKKNNIRFHTTPGAAVQDVGFMWQVFVKMSSYYILPKSFYNYRVDNPNQSIQQGYKTALNNKVEQLWIRELIEQENTPAAFREIAAKCLLWSFYYNYKNRCKGVGKWKYVIYATKLFRKYLPEINFGSFSKKEKDDYKLVSRHPLFYYVKSLIYEVDKGDSITKAKLFGIPVKTCKKVGQKTMMNFLGLPYYKKKVAEGKESKYFFGIRYKTKKLPSKLNTTRAQEVRAVRAACLANAIAATHQQTFPKYKNSNNGKDVMIVACGPTARYYPHIEGVKYLAVNRSITMKEYHFDYCFMSDYPAVREFIEETYNHGCINFFGKFVYDTLQFLSIPESVAEKAHAERFYIEGPHATHAFHDIEFFPLLDFGTVVHMALTFLLYTQPRRIFLTGCDTSTNGYFDNKISQLAWNVQKFVQGYKMLKEVRDYHYPDVEIISINPVGLRGLFRDVYTEDFIKDNPDIQNYTLLKDII